MLCPHHGFDLVLQNLFFYDGLTPACQMAFDIAVGRTIWEKTPQLFNMFERFGTAFYESTQKVVDYTGDNTEKVPSLSTEQFGTMKELDNESVVVEGFDLIPYFEKLLKLVDMDGITEWVDISHFFLL
ncbi:hypothetical protein LIER_10271 [Lithospermum erythrorhizon]|uniref:Uncharacterized protein n=1 Tax=Lithospermum erythrorhizon TaxID=34254 RepID=A0AAV3PK26_LITER